MQWIELLKRTLVPNLIVFLITMLGCLVSVLNFADKADLVRFTMGLFWWGMGFLLVSIAVLAATELRLAHDQWRERRILEAVPRLVRFSDRIDSVTFNKDESVSYDLSLKIESNLDQAVSFLQFPITVDTPPSGDLAEPGIEIKRLTVDGIEKSTEGVYVKKQIRQYVDPADSKRPMEYGVAEVPVSLGRGETSCHVQISMLLPRGAFSNCRKSEYVIVDIPYITDRLRIEIRGENGLRIGAVPGRHGEEHVEATSEIMGTHDTDETMREKGNVTLLNDSMVWQTEFPKLGYRYLVWFRVAGLAEVK